MPTDPDEPSSSDSGCTLPNNSPPMPPMEPPSNPHPYRFYKRIKSSPTPSSSQPVPEIVLQPPEVSDAQASISSTAKLLHVVTGEDQVEGIAQKRDSVIKFAANHPASEKPTADVQRTDEEKNWSGNNDGANGGSSKTDYFAEKDSVKLQQQHAFKHPGSAMKRPLSRKASSRRFVEKRRKH